MKQFSNKFMLCAVEKVPSTIEFPYSVFNELHSIREIEPQAVEKQKKAGSYVDFSLDTTHEELDSSLVSLISNRRPLVLLLFDDSGNHYQVGSSSLPIFAQNTGAGFNSKLKITGKLLKMPY